ncbi:MAG: fluoride efflux transporter CrcB [Saprospiraceae bacterium]|nr:fluoride efflux transporter CrcB [Saprospiraceae bacterium]
MMSWCIVFLGGGLGSVCRYFLAKQWNTDQENMVFPLGTFLANILSCYILGILIQKQINGPVNEDLRLLVATGFCGGFSTFSTFGYEIYIYLQKGQLWFGLGYILLSLILGLAAIYLGIKTNQLT